MCSLPAKQDSDDGKGGGLTRRTGTIIAGMFLYIGGYQVSFGPIAWLLISEVFALDVRDTAIALAVQVSASQVLCLPPAAHTHINLP